MKSAMKLSKTFENLLFKTVSPAYLKLPGKPKRIDYSEIITNNRKLFAAIKILQEQLKVKTQNRGKQA
jgi:hypothetical protein